GIIDEMMASAVHRQIERAANDPKVRAVILKINSPGGGLTASDNIHHDVKTLLVDRNKPVIAAMGGVAASGGYYVACSADQIVAQQTTITGSIGVIAQFYFLNGLLKDKLGITPVTLKMGRQKDWPNMFAADMTPEQQDYLLNTLLKPGYDQFVDIVAEARGMRRDKVLELATGRIFMAKEAKQTGLIDEIGYFERAVELAKEKAGVPRARVVEYVQPFNFAELFGASAQSKALFDLKPEKLAALASPKVMYLWTGF
ncbi:MAG: signal peptide peptidase SppA, partial [Planctomycetes bacterium]|nr:signal peptide peptidase SppA [Planctomycetota bacterium]